MRRTRRIIHLALALFFSPAAPQAARAGAFLFAESNGANVIAHPTGYAGSGGTLAVSVCIDPNSANAASMAVPVQNIVATWNARAVASPNLFFGASNNIGASQYDFESVALHELGHCIGLAHPNLATESGLSGDDQNYTKSTSGADAVYDLGIGSDGVRGSGDDARDDDENLHWFRRSDNNPFVASSTADTTTYARPLTSLPAGHAFAANADRSVGAALGFPNTEAVMQQGTFNDEDQRRLCADDVATLQLGMSGLDLTAGTVDDYTLLLTYGGLSSSCNVVLDFDDTRTSFATCYSSGAFINGTHVRITSANIYFATGISWFFNSNPAVSTSSTSSSTSSSSTSSTTTTTSSSTTSTSTSSSSSTSTTTSSSSSTSSTTSTTMPGGTSTTSSSSTTSSTASTFSTTTTTTVATSTTTTTLPLATCEETPRSDCIAATKGALLVDERAPARGKLRAMLQDLTTALSLGDLGDPIGGSTSYALCFYNALGVRVGALTIERAGAVCGPLGTPCWKTLGASGLRYTDRDATIHGVRRIVLKSGPVATGKALVKARLHPGRSVTGLPPGLPAALATSWQATVQLVASDAACFTLTTDVVVDATAARFSARRR